MYEYFKPEITNSLNSSESVVFKYCSEHIESVSSMSIQKLAEVTFVSKTTVVRMCQKLGFEGFTEFRYYLRKIHDQEIEKKEYVKGQIHKMRKCDVDTMFQVINYEQLQKIAKEIKGKRISFFGKGLSRLICDYAMIQMSLLDLHVTTFDNTHLAKNLGKRMTQEDVLFIVSASGVTPQVIDVANIVKRTDAKIISITEVGMNPLAALADETLFGVMSEDKRVDFDNKSRVSFFILVQALIDVLVEEMSE